MAEAGNVSNWYDISRQESSLTPFKGVIRGNGDQGLLVGLEEGGRNVSNFVNQGRALGEGFFF